MITAVHVLIYLLGFVLIYLIGYIDGKHVEKKKALIDKNEAALKRFDDLLEKLWTSHSSSAK